VAKGVATFFTHAGRSVSFSTHVTDPGSDDESLLWTWGDGTTTSATYLNAPPNPDPLLSPQVNPVNVTNTSAHTWQNACLYNPTVTATDDDGGVGTDTTSVIVTGNVTQTWSDGEWKHAFTSAPNRGDDRQLSPAARTCYTAIVRDLSTVLGRAIPFSTPTDVAAVMDPHGGDDDHTHLAKALAVAWLNFANGVFDWNTLVGKDPHNPHQAMQPFNTVMSAAEKVYLDPHSTHQQLDSARDLIEHLRSATSG
jgi:hypothetical protein